MPDPETGIGDFAQSYSFGVHAVEVAVDEEPGHVKVLNPRLPGYRIPTATEMPPVTALRVQTNDPRGPYGAKGLGEMGLVPTADPPAALTPVLEPDELVTAVTLPAPPGGARYAY